MSRAEIIGYQTEEAIVLGSGGWFEFNWNYVISDTYLRIKFDLLLNDLEDRVILSSNTDPANGIGIGLIDGRLYMNGYPTASVPNIDAPSITVSAGVQYSIIITFDETAKTTRMGRFGELTSVRFINLPGVTSLNAVYRMEIDNGYLSNVSIETRIDTSPLNILSVALDGDFIPTAGTITDDSGGPFITQQKIKLG